MQTLLSSPGRLTTPKEVGAFKSYFRKYGALGVGSPGEPHISEVEKLHMLPLVFGLMPRQVLARTRYDDLIKPAISAHLALLGIPEDNELVTILKNVGDQYFNTEDKLASWYPRKYGISDVRALKKNYKVLKDRQCNRCAFCGVPFDGKITETLDHIIPYRLVGDVSDGSNWQILCELCNSAKGDYISIFQFKGFLNWLYGSRLLSTTAEKLSREVRYLVLARDETCKHAGCTNGPTSSRLFVQSEIRTALSIVDALTLRCEVHAKIKRDCLQDHS
jgi:hypothetical protein